MSGGAYIKMSAGNIEIAGPGTISVRGKNVTLSGPAKIGIDMQNMPSADIHNLSFILKDGEGNIHKNMPYTIRNAKGQTLKGITDKHGRTQQIHTSNPEDLTVRIDNDANGIRLDD